tara:strand:- start:9237 stop:9488 length:252 start_codon:yes stop_codon:yes gene_type:complete
MSKALSQATIDLLSRMSKLVDKGYTPDEAKSYMLNNEPDWRCSRGYKATPSAMRASVKRLKRRLEWERSGSSVIIDNKPQVKR